MRYFVEQVISEKCLLWEALDWLVLGRLPILYQDFDLKEVRGNLRAFFNGPYPHLGVPTERELVSLGYQGDLSTYWDLVSGNIGKERFSEIEESELGHLDFESDPKGWIKAKERVSEAVSRIRDEDLNDFLAIYHHERGRAKLEITGKLISGELPLQGVWCSVKDKLQKIEFAEESPIKKDVASPDAIDWDDSSILIRDLKGSGKEIGTFHLVTLSTKKLCEIFPRRHGSRTQLIMHNSAVFFEAGDIEAPVKSPRGRKPKAAWLKDAMRSWYQTQKEKGKFGEFSKIESDLAAAMDWAASAGVEVKRTTCQTYLSDLLPSRPPQPSPKGPFPAPSE